MLLLLLLLAVVGVLADRAHLCETRNELVAELVCRLALLCGVLGLGVGKCGIRIGGDPALGMLRVDHGRAAIVVGKLKVIPKVLLLLAV